MWTLSYSERGQWDHFAAVFCTCSRTSLFVSRHDIGSFPDTMQSVTHPTPSSHAKWIPTHTSEWDGRRKMSTFLDRQLCRTSRLRSRTKQLALWATGECDPILENQGANFSNSKSYSILGVVGTTIQPVGKEGTSSSTVCDKKGYKHNVFLFFINYHVT